MQQDKPAFLTMNKESSQSDLVKFMPFWLIDGAIILDDVVVLLLNKSVNFNGFDNFCLHCETYCDIDTQYKIDFSVKCIFMTGIQNALLDGTVIFISDFVEIS